jgi:hypothetical protein
MHMQFWLEDLRDTNLGRPNYRREDNIHNPIIFLNLKQHSGDWILPPSSVGIN